MPLNNGAVNQIFPFAAGVAEPNVMPLEQYQTDPARLGGNVSGLARSAFCNRTWRQGMHIAAGLAQYIANRYAPGVLDNGDLDAIEAGMATAVMQNLLWLSTVNYGLPSLVFGPNGKVYIALASSGPGTPAGPRQPGAAGSDTYWLDYAASITPPPSAPAIYNTRTVVNASGSYTPSVTGWARVTLVGGGGGGGKGGYATTPAGGAGGGAGGTTTGFGLSASGGGGGGGAGAATTEGAGCGAGGGAAGDVVVGFVQLIKATAYPISIGGGGAGGTSAMGSGGGGAGSGSGAGGAVAGGVPGQGARGAGNGTGGGNYQGSGEPGLGGHGAVGHPQYGGGGGGGAGQEGNRASTPTYGGVGGPGAQDGQYTTPSYPAASAAGNGGNGGNGAIIIEYYDPAK